MYEEKEVEKIYYNNQEFLNGIINKKVDEVINNLSKYFTLDRKIKQELKILISKQIKEFIKNKIEYKLIIQNLYSNEIKEEALKELPQYILQLR